MNSNRPTKNQFPWVNIYSPNLPENLTSTRFGELNTSYRISQMNFKPTWGPSIFRYITPSGSGTIVGELNGEFKLSTGILTGISASIQTLQRGQYQAGAMGQAGIGVRIPILPIETQYAEWGYFDMNNGFGFGIDSTSSYNFYITSGSKYKTYQSNWNDDRLNGNGPSALSLNYADGIISHIEFTWYGYGDVDYIFFPFNPSTGNITEINTHHLKITGSTSIVDPNQPLTFIVGNGSITTSSFSLFVGGHQFSIIDGGSTPQQRPVSQLISNFTTATNTDWQALIAMRKKLIHGPSNRPNSVRVLISGYGLSADGELETRLTFKGVTTTGSFVTPTGWTSVECASEVKVT